MMLRPLDLKTPQTLAGILIGLWLLLTQKIGAWELNPKQQMWLTQAEPQGLLLVTTNDDQRTRDGRCSLREAVEAINAGKAVFECPAGRSRIQFDPSLTGTTIRLNSTLAVSKDLEIQGLGADNLTLSGSGRVRVLDIGLQAKVTISDLTISQGQSDRGGGVYNQGVLKLNNVVLINNAAEDNGGALFNRYRVSQIELNNTTVTRNTSRNGGGFFNFAGTISFNNSILSDNSGTIGGAVYNRSGEILLKETTVTDNVAEEAGGGIFNQEGSIKLQSSKIIYNEAGSGGGVSNSLGSITGTSSVVSLNQARLEGGGIKTNPGGLVEMISSRISGNTAAVGGGLHSLNSVIKLDNCVLSKNMADVGGAIFNENQHLTQVTRSTLKENIATKGVGSAIYSLDLGALKLFKNQFGNDPNNVVGKAEGSENTPPTCDQGNC